MYSNNTFRNQPYTLNPIHEIKLHLSFFIVPPLLIFPSVDSKSELGTTKKKFRNLNYMHIPNMHQTTPCQTLLPNPSYGFELDRCKQTHTRQQLIKPQTF